MALFSDVALFSDAALLVLFAVFAGADLASRRLNRSTRPPVSTSFCLPVKKGWHSEQSSTRKEGTVERVVNSLPQEQCTWHSTYSGWIPVFMIRPV